LYYTLIQEKKKNTHYKVQTFKSSRTLTPSPSGEGAGGEVQILFLNYEAFAARAKQILYI